MGSYDFRRDPRSRATESTPTESTSRHVPGLQLGVNHDDREESQFQQLLALHGLWRDLERLPSSHRAQRIVAVRRASPRLARFSNAAQRYRHSVRPL